MASETPRGHPTPYRAESNDAFLEVLQRRCSIRSGFLRDTPVPDELIEKILEAAENCPVSAIFVEDAETGERLFPEP